MMNVLALSFMPPAPGRMEAATRTRPTRLRTGWRHALGCCALLSVVGHGVLLSSLSWQPRPPTPASSAAQTAALRGGADRVTQVRFVTQAAASHAPTAPVAPASAAHDAPPQDSPPVPPAIEQTTPAQPPLPPQAPVEAQPPGTVITSTAITDTPTHSGTSTGLEQFIPRPQLTVPPEVLAPVILVAPEDEREAARRVGILSLYIDQTGRVHHIKTEGSGLPPAYERIAREAFMAATFRPGQLDGQDVKSRIRIEVVFDNTPLDGP